MKAAWSIGACALLPALVAAALVANVPDAAHDGGVARALGLGTAPWGALDGPLAGLFAWLPAGTVAARAAMGEVLAVAAAGAVLAVIARALLAACADLPALGAAVAAIAASCATLCPAWQLEGSTVAGSALGAALALAPLALLAPLSVHASRPESGARWRVAVLLAALGLGQDPLAASCGLAGAATLVAVGPRARRGLVAAWTAGRASLLGAAATGLLPAMVTLARARAAGGSLGGRMAWAWTAERAGAGNATGAPWPMLQAELGSVLLALAVAGAVLVLIVPRARALGAALAVVMLSGLSSGWAGAALGPTRFGAPVLAGLGAACVLAGAAMQTVVRAVAEARVPMARASAALVVVLELVAPVDQADESLRLGAARARGAGTAPDEPPAAWDDAVWGALPPLAAVLVSDRAVALRAGASRALGSLRGDLAVIVPSSPDPEDARALATDARLVPLWRDLALDGAPGEDALSSLANARPVAMAFEPEWSKILGKHLVPWGVLDRFEPEPRGASDRKRALDAFTPARERLARAIVRDRDLSAATAGLLRRRLLGLAASGDRDLVGTAVADLHAFSPDDPIAAQVVARQVGAKTRP